jgi:SAM-dependent methyltransferase
MEEFYVLATEDYRQLALAADWAALLGERARQGWSLLDVACGSGKFPTALARFTAVASLPDVAYDLLDPSAFSIATARAALAPPFMPRNDLVMPLQELPSSCGPYDVVWATIRTNDPGGEVPRSPVGRPAIDQQLWKNRSSAA